MIMVPPIKVNKAVASTARIKKQIYITPINLDSEK